MGVYHTYMTAHIAEDFAPNQDDMEMERIKAIAQDRLSGTSRDDPKNNFMNKFFTEGGAPVNKLEDASRINQQGQIFFVLGFPPVPDHLLVGGPGGVCAREED